MVLRARKEGSVERKTGGSRGHEGERRDGRWHVMVMVYQVV